MKFHGATFFCDHAPVLCAERFTETPCLRVFDEDGYSRIDIFIKMTSHATLARAVEAFNREFAEPVAEIVEHCAGGAETKWPQI
jgi:hypothetical protein